MRDLLRKRGQRTPGDRQLVAVCGPVPPALLLVEEPAQSTLVRDAHGSLRAGRAAAWALVLCEAVGSSSCFFSAKKPPRAFIPPPVQTPVIARTPPPELPPAPELAALPGPDVFLPLPGGLRLPPPPPAPVQRRNPVANAPKPGAQDPPVAEPAPAPRLGQIFPPDKLQEYNRELKESLDRVDGALVRLERKKLNSRQREDVERIRTFRKQAEQAREQDLVTAVSLARRADVLAKDLLERLP